MSYQLVLLLLLAEAVTLVTSFRAYHFLESLLVRKCFSEDSKEGCEIAQEGSFPTLVATSIAIFIVMCFLDAEVLVTGAFMGYFFCIFIANFLGLFFALLCFYLTLSTYSETQ